MKYDSVALLVHETNLLNQKKNTVNHCCTTFVSLIEVTVVIHPKQPLKNNIQILCSHDTKWSNVTMY